MNHDARVPTVTVPIVGKDLPPRRRSAATLKVLARRVATKRFSFPIQCCAVCFALQYPARDVCRECLSDNLDIVEHERNGKVIATGCVRHSLEPWFAECGPWRVGLVALVPKVNVIALICEGVSEGGETRLSLTDGPNGIVLPVALPPDGQVHAGDEMKLKRLARS